MPRPSFPPFSGRASHSSPVERTAGRGFTLIELLIASFLSVIVAAMMFAVLDQQDKAAARTDASSGMQEQLRFALQVMSRQVRMAGYGIGFRVVGGPSTFNDMDSLRACDACGGYDFDGTNDTATGSDQLLLVYRNPATEFRHVEAGVEDPLPCSTQRLWAEPNPALLDTHAEPVLILPGDVVTCYDESEPGGGRGYAWEVNGVASVIRSAFVRVPVGVVDNSATAPYSSLCTNTLPNRMTCGLLRSSQVGGGIAGFYLRNETLWMDDNGDSINQATGSLQLTQYNSGNTDDIPLARGIEDFQTSFCIPGYPNPSTVSDVQRALEASQCISSPGSAHWRSPLELTRERLPYATAVRLTLVAKGPIDRSGRLLVSVRPAVENHSPSDSVDTGVRPATTRYPRLVQSTVIQLPNLRYLQGFVEEYTH